MRTRSAIVALICIASALGAQEAEMSVRLPTDSALSRARQLILSDHAADGRKLIDSVMTAAADDEALYGEALFWRGALAATAAEAERSYRRLLIEAPLHARAEDALLQLAQLEAARGDRKSASDHLYRYMVTYGPSNDRPARSRVSLWLVKLLFEQNQVAKGCDAARMSDEAIPRENVELHNQLDAYAQRCTYAENAPVDSADKPDTTKHAPARAAEGARTERAPTVVYSVQVAAYDSKEAAARMAEGLVSRGLEARVDGTSRPFRVRIGRFATRAEAVKLAQTLKTQGQNGFVTLVAPR